MEVLLSPFLSRCSSLQHNVLLHVYGKNGCFMLGPLGTTEIAVICGLGLLLFGAKRLPELGRSVGEGLREFKRSLSSTSNDEPEAKSEKQADQSNY